MGLERVGLPGGDLIPPYLDRLSRQIANLIHDARRQVKPATITYGTGRCTLAAHRDYWDEASGQFVCGFNPLGQADDTVLVARVSSEDGPTIATVVNYACHPTTLGWENTLISPDYPGTTCAVVEQATGAPCVFLQGASGDLGPREGFVGDVRVAERNGRQLGFAVLAALEALPAPGTCLEYVGPVVSGATLGIWAHRPLEGARLRSVSAWAWRSWTVDLPYRADLPSHEQACEERKRWEAKEEVARRTGDAAGARASRAMVERMTRLQTRLSGLPRGSYFPMPVTAWRLGDAVWLAVEGEPYSLFQRALRLHCGSTPVVVMALTNGTRPGYLPDAATYGKGVYQESVAALEPGSLERLISAIEEQLAAWGIGVPRVQGPEMLREPEHR
jgi:hypothetical protein